MQLWNLSCKFPNFKYLKEDSFAFMIKIQRQKQIKSDGIDLIPEIPKFNIKLTLSKQILQSTFWQATKNYLQVGYPYFS